MSNEIWAWNTSASLSPPDGGYTIRDWKAGYLLLGQIKINLSTGEVELPPNVEISAVAQEFWQHLSRALARNATFD